MKRINIGLMAHVDAGKTTITERLLYMTGAIRSMGSVDKGTAQSDFMSIERNRGISVRAAVTMIHNDDITINLIDTPGHMDFSGEVERALMVLDGAVLVVSAVEGVQAQTEIIWNVLSKRGIPVIIFINKIDRIGANVQSVISGIKERLTNELCQVYSAQNEGSNNVYIEKSDITEEMAGRDETLFDTYLKGNATNDEAYKLARKLVGEGLLHPVLCGSAMHDIGIKELLNSIEDFIPSSSGNPESQLAGIVFKVEHDPIMGKIAHTRLYSGTLRNRDNVLIVGREVEEKVTQIRKFHGEKYKDVGVLCAGDIAGLCGLSSVISGDIIGDRQAVPETIKWVRPLLRVSVSATGETDFQSLARALAILNEEDPLLDCFASNNTGEMIISVTGVIQTEVISELLRERFKVEAYFGQPSVIYKETPSGVGNGADSYTMPKPCWAVLSFIVEPAPRGSGITYECQVSPKYLPYRYQNHVKTAVSRTLKQGLLGWEVTDVKVTLVNGQYHEIHTHPLDFFVCTPMALMKALLDCGTLLLEPILSFYITAPEECGRRIIGEIIKMRGTFESPIIDNKRFEIKGLIPVASSLEFPVRLASITAGQGILSTRFHSYEECPKEIQSSSPRKGVNPLERSKFILWARNALGRFGETN